MSEEKKNREPVQEKKRPYLKPKIEWEEPDRAVAEVYRFGRKRYDCHVSRRPAPTLSP